LGLKGWGSPQRRGRRLYLSGRWAGCVRPGNRTVFTPSDSATGTRGRCGI